MISRVMFIRLSCRILRALRSGTAAEALDDAESLLNDDSVTWRDLVLVAELNIALSKDATALLVKVGLFRTTVHSLPLWCTVFAVVRSPLEDIQV